MSNVVPMQEVKSATVITPMDMLDRAISSGAGIETLEKLMALQERHEANQARKAFDDAMAAAKSEIPTIRKNRQVGFDSKKQGASRTDYRHEDLAEIARTVDPILSKHGLSYRFKTSSNPNEPISVTCRVSHRLGYSEENTLSAGRDDSGNKNSIQAIGSTLTYLQRYTLKAALGLAASHDDDGQTSEAPAMITQDQVGELVAMLESSGSDKARFLKYFKIERLQELPANAYQTAVTMLNAKKRG